MTAFRLKIITPERVFYEGEATRLVVRTSEGDVGILHGHAKYVAALDIGVLQLVNGEEKRRAALHGGILQVSPEETVILAPTCEWGNEIDLERAQRAEEAAREKLSAKESGKEHDLAAAKLKRAITRIQAAK